MYRLTDFNAEKVCQPNISSLCLRKIYLNVLLSRVNMHSFVLFVIAISTFDTVESDIRLIAMGWPLLASENNATIIVMTKD